MQGPIRNQDGKGTKPNDGSKMEDCHPAHSHATKSKHTDHSKNASMVIKSEEVTLARNA